VVSLIWQKEYLVKKIFNILLIILIINYKNIKYLYLNTEATVDLLRDFDEIILATGIKPRDYRIYLV